MKVRFLELAQQELDDAVVWYEHQQPGLGLQFLDEIDRAIKRIAPIRNHALKLKMV